MTVLEEKAELMLADMPPYLADDLYVQDIIGAAANELQLIDDFIAEVREKLRPQNSDDTYRLLGLWEAFLGLPGGARGDIPLVAPIPASWRL